MKAWLRHSAATPYLILLLAVLAANWQLVFLQSGMEWDMMNFWMPWRYYMSECYQNGIVPLWNPYAQGGYPVHGDLQGPAYSPEAILVSFLFGQNIHVLNYCFVFYLFVASAGMYKLCFFFTGKKEVSVLAGIIYALSGFNVAHGHYFYIVVSVALVPLIFYYFFKILDKPAYADALKFAAILFWHITTGNPSFLIISGYLMALIFVIYALQQVKDKQLPALWPVIKKLSLVFVLTVLMALPVICNTMQIVPLTTRKDGLDLAYAGDESFYYQNFIAFLIPLITITNVDLTGYEQELWSPYIGAFTVLLFIIGLFGRKNFFEWMLLLLGIGGLLIALGLQWPVYPFLHKHVPLFNIFRMPNLSLLFFLIAAIILSAKVMCDEEKIRMLFKKGMIWVFALIWLASILYMVYIAVAHKQGEVADLFADFDTLRKWIYGATPAQIAFFHACVFGTVLMILFVLNLFARRKLVALLIASAVDVIANYQLGGTARIFSVEPARSMNAYFARFPKNFAPPAPMALERVRGISKDWKGYWLNTSIFNKQPDYPNSNNFELSAYLDLLLQKPRLAANVWKNSYAFLADSLVAAESFTDSVFRSERSVITLPRESVQRLSVRHFSNQYNELVCRQFLPQKQVYTVKNNAPTVFVIAQNRTPLWNYEVNGRPCEPMPACGAFPAFAFPPGEWKIEARYASGGYDALLLFSLTLFTVIVLLSVYYSMPAGRFKKGALAGVPLLYAYCLITFLFADPAKFKDRVYACAQRHASDDPQACLVNNSTLPLRSDLQTNFVLNEDLMRLAGMLDTVKRSTLNVLTYDRYFAREAEQLIACLYGPPAGEEELGNGAKVHSFRRAPARLLLDTLITPEAVVDAKSPYSAGILLDSLNTVRYKAGDVMVISADIKAERFDFPGVALELSYAGKSDPVYKYGNISTITASRRERAGIVWELQEKLLLKKALCYVWNPSVSQARVHQLRLRIYRR